MHAFEPQVSQIRDLWSFQGSDSPLSTARIGFSMLHSHNKISTDHTDMFDYKFAQSTTVKSSAQGW